LPPRAERAAACGHAKRQLQHIAPDARRRAAAHLHANTDRFTGQLGHLMNPHIALGQ